MLLLFEYFFEDKRYFKVSSILFPVTILFGERISREIFTAVPWLQTPSANFFSHIVAVWHYKSDSYAISRREFLLYFQHITEVQAQIVVGKASIVITVWYDCHALFAERDYIGGKIFRI